MGPFRQSVTIFRSQLSVLFSGAVVEHEITCEVISVTSAINMVVYLTFLCHLTFNIEQVNTSSGAPRQSLGFNLSRANVCIDSGSSYFSEAWNLEADHDNLVFTIHNHPLSLVYAK
jgi:hypothetical protein